MNPKSVIFSLLLLLVVLALVVSRIQHEPRAKEAFDRHATNLTFSPKALCQEACLGIGHEEVRDIMQKGIIHFSLSERQASPCPRFVLQGKTGTGVNLRVYFIQCKAGTEVLQCIDLKRRDSCRCPQTEE